MASRLRTAQVYGVYARFLVYALLLAAAAGCAPTRPLLDRTEWAALKNICAGA